jgi:pantoate--beta-alanine ligase
MKIFKSLSEWQATRNQLDSALSIGFVPTMGNLHAGHASLFERSVAENDLTVSSLFINPKQFNQVEDFIHYPKTLDEDIHLLSELGVNYCIVPEEQSMYQDGYRYQVNENAESLSLEGAHRPGHFTGVLTIVMKLLNLAKPSRAYFGEKDYQQFKLIHGMAKAFFMDVEVICCKTIREPSGLAYSSRNNRLTTDEKITAASFASALRQPLAIPDLKKQIEALGIDVEYIEDHDNRRYAAVKIGAVRLIDNVELCKDIK